MANPKLSRKIAVETVKFVSGSLADGFALVGNPNAKSEGVRRFNKASGKQPISRQTFRDRVIAAAETYNLKPTARAGKRLKAPYRAPRKSVGKTFDPDKAASEVLFWLRKPQKHGAKTLADLSARVKLTIHEVRTAIETLTSRGVNVQKIGEHYDIPPRPAQSYTEGAAIELLSLDDDTFVFGAFGDLHAGSKHTRWDVREDLVRQSELAGAQCIFDTGNWIDGESHFNRYDLEVIGLEQQCQHLAKKHPRTHLPIYAVTGDDHEGWYAIREGINVGHYNENIMRTAGHDWTDLGYMEAHVTLKNKVSGKKATLAVVHPGGGSAYALSYSIQKIVESYEGGEKPHVALYGHYHKLWAGIIRNIWVAQTGTQQDQTPFMRKKRLEAHVGGCIITLRQDRKTGSILEMTPRILRYFNEGFEAGTDRWSHHGPVGQPKRSALAIRA